LPHQVTSRRIRVENWFQGKQITVRCFLLLVASASHQEEEEEKRTGFKVNKQQLNASWSWLPQPVTSRRRRRRRGELVPK
jgi:hypothetical protein